LVSSTASTVTLIIGLPDSSDPRMRLGFTHSFH
jgi:hypothetical protein